jgi:steroid 5-alpha reductase family enzyme
VRLVGTLADRRRGGAWWTVVSPALMTFLLLKVSGVAMLERTIGKRRPDYAAYIAGRRRSSPGFPAA